MPETKIKSRQITHRGRKLSDRLDDVMNANNHATLQAAVDAAGPDGAVLVPANYAGSDAVNNNNNIPIVDLRHKQLGIHSAVGPMYPVADYPFGNDFRLTARGPADTYIEHLHVVATTTASLSVGWNNNVPISAVTFKGRLETMTGGAEKFSESAQLVIGRETANEEQVDQGNWEYVDATHINILCTKTHTGTTDIDQGGSTLLVSQDLYVASHLVKPSQNTTWDAPLRLKDLGGRIIAYIPSNIDNAMPYGGWQWGAIQMGRNGTNKDLLYQHALPASQVKWRDHTGATIATLDDAGALTVSAGVSTGIGALKTNGAAGELQVGGRVNSAITSTNDAFVAWQDSADPLNPSATAGSLLLAARNTPNAAINLATQNTLRAVLNAAGWRVVAGFGCNGKTPQTAVTVNAAATDLATTTVLVNQLRAALIACGICV